MRRRQFLGLAAVLGGSFALPLGCGGSDENSPGDDNDSGTGNDANNTDATTGEFDSSSPGDDASPGDAKVKRNGTAIVIGSGFGGAISALRLGEAGVKTIVLERGKRWDIKPTFDTFCENTTPDGRAAWLSTKTVVPFLKVDIPKYTGVLERVDFDYMSIFMGAGVGGGSIVYGGMTVIPPEALFKKAFPPEVDYDELVKTYYPRVKKMIGASTMPLDLLALDYYRFSRVFQAQAALAAMPTMMIDQVCDWEVIRKELKGELPKSALTGQLIYGNNTGSKISLDRTYLPAAEKTGNVTIMPMHQVTAIGQGSDGRYTVDVDTIDEQGKVTASATMTCDYLVLAAGSFHTTKLLLKAKAKGTLPKLNDEIGKGWGPNGNAMFTRNTGVGVPTGKDQGSPPGVAMQDFNNPVAPTLVEAAQFPIGVEFYTLLHLACVYAPERGTFTYDTAKEDVVLDWPAANNKTARDAAMNCANRVNAANPNSGNPGPVYLPDRDYKEFTYHPCGGAVLGKAIDFFGRVKGYTNLYVIDGSMMPGTAACANPSFTIAALSERNIERVITEDNLS